MSILRTFLRSHAARDAMMTVLYAGSLVAILGMGLILAADLDKLAVAQLCDLPQSSGPVSVLERVVVIAFRDSLEV